MLKDTAKALFQKAHQLVQEGHTRSEIARRLHVTRKTVREWLNQEEYRDERGWQQGRRRSYSQEEEDRILAIRDDLEANAFYWGKDEVRSEYKKRFPEETPPSLWFIEETIRRHGRQTSKPKERRPGITRYLGYPIHLLAGLGPVQEGIDFIGHKYLKGREEPIHLLARYYFKPIGLYLVNRTENERAESMVRLVQHDWRRVGRPDCAYMDNGNAMYGPAKAKGFVGRFLQAMLAAFVTPVFTPPRSPWANGPTEGSNSVFGKKIWNRFTFENVENVDRVLKQFNQTNLRRAHLEHVRKATPSRSWRPRIYFVRFATLEPDREQHSIIEILNDHVAFSNGFAHQYVLSELDIEKERLTVMVERDRKPLVIHEQRFPVRFTKT